MARSARRGERDDRFAWTLLLAFALPASTEVASAQRRANATMRQAEYRIESEQVHYDLSTGDFAMTKPVRFSQPGTDVRGDRASGNVRRKIVVMMGNVVLHDDGRSETASRLRGGGASTLTTDRLVIEGAVQRFTAIGHVRYRQADRTAVAQRAVLNQGSRTLELTGGDVVLVDSSTTIHAQNILYDLVTTQVRASGDPVTVHRVSSR